jgi:carnitine O-acetyltransferase
MTDPAVSDDQRRAASRAAADAHVRRAKQCQAGDAPEQHLWGGVASREAQAGARVAVPLVRTWKAVHRSPRTC